MSHSTIVLVADGCEDIETITIVDVLRRAGIKVTICSIHSQSTHPHISMANGCSIIPDSYIDVIIKDSKLKNSFDAVVLPGGSSAAKSFSACEKVQSLIKAQHESGKLVAAICASPTALFSILGKTTKVTSYPCFESDFLGKCIWLKEDKVVHSDNIITSQGPATAIPFSLKIVEILNGSGVSSKVAKQILYE